MPIPEQISVYYRVVGNTKWPDDFAADGIMVFINGWPKSVNEWFDQFHGKDHILNNLAIYPHKRHGIMFLSADTNKMDNELCF